MSSTFIAGVHEGGSIVSASFISRYHKIGGDEPRMRDFINPRKEHNYNITKQEGFQRVDLMKEIPSLLMTQP
jgi:hypothetical protein